MDFREINTFIHVANQESFSKAADVLGYTQAAVSIQIKQLESELGTRLFDRIGKHISLTHQGKVFYQYALRITSEIEEAKDVLSGSQDLNILSRYHALHPAVEISIITDSPEALLDMMNKSCVDLVYFMDKRMYDPKWVKILEEPENIIFVASPDHPCTKKSPLTLNKIISEPFILTEKDASYRFILDQYLAAYGQEIHPRVESSSTDFIIQLLLKNEFLSFVPQFTVQNQILAADCIPQGQTSDTGDESILPAGAVTLEKGRFPCPSNCFTDFRQSVILLKIICHFPLFIVFITNYFPCFCILFLDIFF